MRVHYSTLSLVRVVLLTVAIVSVEAAQVPGGATSTRSHDPQPEDAAGAILSAFETFQVVAIGDNHGTKDLNDFVLSLVRHPAFPNVVNDIVIEGSNSLLQPILDRYIAGDDMPISQARQLWREATNPSGGVNDFNVRLFQLVRQINGNLSPTKRLRVLASEAPGDQITSPEEREAHIAAVVEKEVLTKNRKALMFTVVATCCTE
jgi:hypothetical protein